MPPPWKDAVAGTFLAGEALAGAWWAYPPQAGIGLAGIPPTLVILEQDIVPQAKLSLVAVAPGLSISTELEVSQAGLGLGAIPPALRMDAVAVAPQAGLGLGAPLPTLHISTLVAVPQAGLGFQAQPFTLTISQVIAVPESGLWLLAVLPDYAGVLWLYPVICEDVILEEPLTVAAILAAADCTGEALAVPPVTVLSLEAAVCTEIELGPVEVN